MNDNESNVVFLNMVTRIDLPADRVISGAFEKLDKVVILGYTKDGEEYFASSIADGADVIWLMERLKKKLLDVPDDLSQ